MCGVQWEPNAERLAILPRGQAFALVYETASRALVRVPTGRAVRPPIERPRNSQHIHGVCMQHVRDVCM